MKKIVKKLDVLIVIIVLTVALISALIINASFKQGKFVNVQVDGDIVAVLDLNENTQYDVVKNNIITNTVIVENGYVNVVDASCPDKICVNHKRINQTGESIVCLPNKVVITVSDTNGKTEIDGVAQ